jgi:hypothetical protein
VPAAPADQNASNPKNADGAGFMQATAGRGPIGAAGVFALSTLTHLCDPDRLRRDRLDTP